MEEKGKWKEDSSAQQQQKSLGWPTFESEEAKGGGGGGGNGDLWLSFARRKEKEKSLHFPLSYTPVPLLFFSSSFLWESIGTDCSLRGKGRGPTTNLTYISVASQEKLSANFLSFPPFVFSSFQAIFGFSFHSFDAQKRGKQDIFFGRPMSPLQERASQQFFRKH